MKPPSELAARYLDGHSRLFLWPAKEQPRREVAEWLATLLEPGREYTEREVTQLLADRAISPDANFLRREMIDRKLWSRDRYGRCYQLMNTWTFTTQDGNINVHRAAGQAAITLVGQPGLRPHLHPVVSPSGVTLTEDAPPHHPWQHGIYVGLNGVNGVGFWKEFEEDGKVVVQSLTEETGSLKAVSHYLTPDGTHLLTETQRWTPTEWQGGYAIDFEWTLTAETDVDFGHYEYGGLFLRMPYRDELGGECLTSAGSRDDGIQADWVSVSMPIEGTEASGSIAILSHPTNPVSPMPWRIDYQLGVGPARCIAGAWSLPTGTSATERYRILVADGALEASSIAAAFEEYR